MTREDDYIAYHVAMTEIGDLDPAYPIMLYVCDRYEFNAEQRYWLAFLYASCYSVPTAFYIWNEFPDFENIDLGRMSRWWSSNRPRLLFQTDRRWTRSRNQFVPMVASYAEFIGQSSQQARFASLVSPSPSATYDSVYLASSAIRFMGRYTLFLYLEAIQALTGLPMEPTGLDLRNSESSRNGLCYCVGADELLTGHDYGRTTVPLDLYPMLDHEFERIMSRVRSEQPQTHSTVWSVETSLCAYKKIHRGTRYLGFYIDRQHDEIAQMQSAVPDGVDWTPLWDFRRGHFAPPWLKEERRLSRLSGSVLDPRSLRPSDPAHWYQRFGPYEDSQ